MQAFKEIVVEKCEVAGVFIIFLNRPDRGNAYTPTVCDELDEAFRWADQDDSCKVVILAGKGKNFCVGADLSPSSDTSSVGRGQDRDLGGVASLSIFHCRKPVIAALHGVAVGIGITLVLPADLRVAEEDCRVSFPFAKRGLSVEAASSFFLPQLVGLGRAVEWCLTGRLFTAKDEANSGLFTCVVPKGQALTKAKALAAEMVQNCSQVSLAYIKRAFYSFPQHPHDAHVLESKIIQNCFGSQESTEGFLSFLEKRAPKFPGLAKDVDPNLDEWVKWRAPYPTRRSKL